MEKIKFRYKVMEIISYFIQKYRMVKHSALGYNNIHKTVILESNLNLDRVYPKGIHIGENTLVGSRATILSHEHIKRDPNNPRNPWITDTYIGKNCFIGVGAFILPGVKIGDEVVIGAGSIVTKDIPSNAIAVGCPAKVIKTNIKMDSKAILIESNV